MSKEETESEVDDNEELRLTRRTTVTRFIKSFSKMKILG